MHTASVVARTERAEEVLSYCARVSNPDNQENWDTAPKLIRYLIKHKHWSPFEMVNVVMEINTTRDIARQILRHRSFSFQEFSQRYAEPKELEASIYLRPARLQDPKNRQASIVDGVPNSTTHDWEAWQDTVQMYALEAYSWAVKAGIAKEVARAVLPEGLTATRLYMNGNLRSWIHYCELRMGQETQLEHRIVAEECWKALIGVFPWLKDGVNEAE